MSKIQISTDSVSDLGEALMKKYNIKYMPLLINMGDYSEPDGDGMPAKIFEFVKNTGKLPKTAARSTEDYIEFFKTHKPTDGEIIHFAISSKISASYEMAKKAADTMEGVYVIDTRSLSTGSGLSVLYACDLVEQGGLTGAEISRMVEARTKNVQASFIVDTLEFLHKGGRCSGLSRFFAALFKIKPMICLIGGEMKVGKKYIGKIEKSIIKYVDDTLKTFSNPDLERCFITYTTLPNDTILDEIKQQILSFYPFKEIIPTEAGGTITSHCGKNTIGILYYNDGNR